MCHKLGMEFQKLSAQPEMLCSCCRFGGGQQRPPRTVEVPLKLTLKELYTGTTKRLKITRRVYNKQTGKLEPKEVQPQALSAGLAAYCVHLCLQQLHRQLVCGCKALNVQHGPASWAATEGCARKFCSADGQPTASACAAGGPHHQCATGVEGWDAHYVCGQRRRAAGAAAAGAWPAFILPYRLPCADCEPTLLPCRVGCRFFREAAPETSAWQVQRHSCPALYTTEV